MSEKKSDEKKEELAEEIDLHDDMIEALVELLESKGVLKEGEWDNLLRKKLKEGQSLQSFRDLK